MERERGREGEGEKKSNLFTVGQRNETKRKIGERFSECRAKRFR